MTVVDVFHRLARRYCERHGYIAVWERPLLTGARGRPQSIDVSLFHPGRQDEIRLELGLYTKGKLAKDATKLSGSRHIPGLPGYSVSQSLLVLWNIRQAKTTASVVNQWVQTFKRDAEAISTAGNLTVNPLFTSTLDLFTSDASGHRYAAVGLFEVQ